MTRWIVWAVVLAITQGSGTLASRARNTSSFTYHGFAAFFSHSCFFIAQVIGIDVIVEVLKTRAVGLALTAFAVYAIASTTGSILAHWAAMTFLENNQARRVGAYVEPTSANSVAVFSDLLNRRER
jgi:hypothetical protein